MFIVTLSIDHFIESFATTFLHITCEDRLMMMMMNNGLDSQCYAIIGMCGLGYWQGVHSLREPGTRWNPIPRDCAYHRTVGCIKHPSKDSFCPFMPGRQRVIYEGPPSRICIGFIECFTTTFLHTHHSLFAIKWVDEDDWWGWGWLERKARRDKIHQKDYIKIRPEAPGVWAKNLIPVKIISMLNKLIVPLQWHNMSWNYQQAHWIEASTEKWNTCMF